MHQQGFSILEVLVVLVIISITAMVGISYMPQSSTNSLHADGIRLTQLFTLAQNYAHQQGVNMIWQPESQGFTFTLTDANTKTLPTPLLPQSWLSPRPVQVSIEPAHEVVRFNAHWLRAPYTVILDNGIDRLRIQKDPYGRCCINEKRTRLYTCRGINCSGYC